MLLLYVVLLFFTSIYFYLLLTAKRSKGSKKNLQHEKPKVKIWSFPIVGNSHWFVAANPGDLLLQVGKKYGPVVFTRFGIFNAVVINGHNAIKNSCKVLSLTGRPDTFYKTISGNKALLFSDDTTEIRKFLIRRMKTYGQSATERDRITHEEISYTLELLEKNLGKPQDVKHMFSISTVNVILFFLLGMRFDRDDSRVKSVIASLNLLSELPNPLSRAVLIMPWLGRWFPKLTGQDFVVKTCKELLNALEAPLIEHDKHRVNKQPRDITDEYYEQFNNPTFFSPLTNSQKQVWSFILVDIFIAAVETTSGIIEWSLAYLAFNPEVQRKVQMELDQVLAGKLPELIDRPNMPYFQAVIEEVLRLRPMVGLAWHSAPEDTEFDGHFIPKDTIVLANYYGANHDPAIWDKPETFHPERFIDEEGKFKRNEYLLSFGTGRRSCVGETSARDQIFLFLARILLKYHVSPVGKFPDFNFGIITRIKDFKLVFEHR